MAMPRVACIKSDIAVIIACILSLRDEYLKLGLGEPAERLAERVLLLEESCGQQLGA